MQSAAESGKRRLHFARLAIKSRFDNVKWSRTERLTPGYRELLSDEDARVVVGFLDQLGTIADASFAERVDSIQSTIGALPIESLLRVFHVKRRGKLMVVQDSNEWAQYISPFQQQTLSINTVNPPRVGNHIDVSYDLITPGDNTVKPREQITIKNSDRVAQKVTIEVIDGRVMGVVYRKQQPLHHKDQIAVEYEITALEAELPRSLNGNTGTVRVVKDVEISFPGASDGKPLDFSGFL